MKIYKRSFWDTAALNVFFMYNMDKIKTSIVLPRELYIELKKRAVEEGKTVKEAIIDAILKYLASKGNRSKLKGLILKPSERAGPEDLREYGGEEIGF